MTEIKVGLIGFSAQDFNKVDAAVLIEDCMATIEKSHPIKNTKRLHLVSGLTDMGIPAIGYRMAKSRGWTTVGFSCSKAFNYDCFDVDAKIIVGENWGDESEDFIDYCDIIIKCGGSKQSTAELALAKNLGKEIYELDLANVDLIRYIERALMMDRFKIRTEAHIDRVQKNAKILEAYDPGRCNGLVNNARFHDASKYEEPEYTPYLYINWKYHNMRQDLPITIPSYMDSKMHEATLHHILINRHHPEFWDADREGVRTSLNPSNRDLPTDRPVDATKMPLVYIAEMVADWFSMSQELGTHPKDWANKNVNIRWNFTPNQIDFIFELIDNVWLYRTRES